MQAKKSFNVREWARPALQKRGFSVRLSNSDLVIDGLAAPIMVEVRGKYSTYCSDGLGWHGQRWQFYTFCFSQDLATVVMLVCIGDQGQRWPFIIPSWELCRRFEVAITSEPGKYKGRFAPFLNNWNVIYQVAARKEKYLIQSESPLWGQVN